MPLSKKLAAEFIGTFWLVLGGSGSAVLAAAFPAMGIGFVGVSLAFGLTVLTMAYAIGHISGCHLNPAVSIGLWAGKRFPASELFPYIVAQVLGALAGGAILLVIASGKPGWFDAPRMLAANGYGAHSPGGYSMLSGFVAIGLGLTLIHLISIPVTNTSVNPARSTAPALMAGSWALEQLWLFWVAPIIGALVAGGLYSWLGGHGAQVTGDR
jgi:aquaporin Z